jgi:hypothetical protein
MGTELAIRDAELYQIDKVTKHILSGVASIWYTSL